jgi:mannose-6-phosphate isomerase-like protein (cupin superfamily)
MYPRPIIFGGNNTNKDQDPGTSSGNSFVIHEWKGSGPPYMHVHYRDDEAWHILEGTLCFSFPNEKLEVKKGTTVLVPAGLPHTYTACEGSRYLMILTPALDRLIAELHKTPIKDHGEVLKKYDSEIIT